MKTAVIYKSKYNATKKYAMMLQDELACDVYEASDYKNIKFEDYDNIIFAGAIYASGISGLNILRKVYPHIQDKKIAILCVGASPYNEKAINEIKVHNLKDDLKDVPVFYARGAWDESIMSFKDRCLCKMLQKMVAKQDAATLEPWMVALLEASGQVCDWTNRTYLDPLIEYMKL